MTEPSMRSDRSTQLSRMNSRAHLTEGGRLHASARLEDEEDDNRGCRAGCRKVLFHPSTRGQKIWCAVAWTLIFVLSIVLFSVIFPRFVDKVVNPLIKSLQAKFTPRQIAAIIFAAYVILPFFIFLPFNWTAWLAGAVFPWWLAFLIIAAACTTGMILQWWAGRTILHSRLERSLAKKPNKSINVTLRAIELAGPMKVVALLRLGPFPYGLLNYLLAVPKSITFWRHIIPSIPAELPSRLMQVYFGQNLGTIADLFRGRIQKPGVVAYNIILLAVGFLLIGACGWYANRALKQVQAEELEQEAAAARAADPEAQHEEQQKRENAVAGLRTDSCGAASSLGGSPVRRSLKDSAMHGRDCRPDLDVVLGEKGANVAKGFGQ